MDDDRSLPIGQHRLMHRRRVGVAAIVVLGPLIVCGGGRGGVQISRDAVQQASGAVDTTSVTVVKLSDDDVDRLASQAGVLGDAIRQVSPS